MNTKISTATTASNADDFQAIKACYKSFITQKRPIQNWSIPDSIIYYISKSPSTSKCYKKLTSTSAYFMVKNPIAVGRSVLFTNRNNEWSCNFNFKCFKIDNYNIKIWPEKMIIINLSTPEQYSILTFLPKLYRCDALYVEIMFQDILLIDLQKLTFNCKSLEIINCSTLNPNGSIVVLEKLIAAFPYVKQFTCKSRIDEFITKFTIQKLIKIPHFSNICTLKVSNISELFDIDHFYSYIKANTNTKFYLEFGNISLEYSTHLQKIVNEIVVQKENEYNSPIIFFFGIEQESYNKMVYLYNKI